MLSKRLLACIFEEMRGDMYGNTSCRIQDHDTYIHTYIHTRILGGIDGVHKVLARTYGYNNRVLLVSTCVSVIGWPCAAGEVNATPGASAAAVLRQIRRRLQRTARHTGVLGGFSRPARACSDIGECALLNHQCGHVNGIYQWSTQSGCEGGRCTLRPTVAQSRNDLWETYCALSSRFGQPAPRYIYCSRSCR